MPSFNKSNCRFRWTPHAAVYLLLLFLGCGLFQPREVEPPDPNQSGERTDPLNLADILDNSRSEIGFSRLDYEDLFNEEFQYVDRNNAVFSKERFLNRLNTIKAFYRAISVRWDITDTNEREPFQFSTNEIAVLQSRTYNVFTDSSSVTVSRITVDSLTGQADTLYEYDYSGEASIQLRFDYDINSWTIVYWREGLDISFFHPEFTD